MNDLRCFDLACQIDVMLSGLVALDFGVFCLADLTKDLNPGYLSIGDWEWPGEGYR